MFVMLFWSDYHNLSANASGIYSEDVSKLEVESESYLDKIYQVGDEVEALALINAFEQLAQADWTPNQTGADKDYYSDVRTSAQRVLDKYNS